MPCAKIEADKKGKGAPKKVLGALLPKVKIKKGKGVYMSKHVSISSLAVLKTATILLALATGVFSSKADHFEWSEPNTGGYYADPPPDNDGILEWDNTSSAEESDYVSGSTAGWYGYVQSHSQVDTEYPDVITSGHTLSTYAEVYSQFGGEWVSDEDGPAVDATIDYTAEVWGTVFGTTYLNQGIQATTNFIEGANANAQYIIDSSPLLDGCINLGGGITNGFSTNSMGGGVQSYTNLDITPVEYDLEHITQTGPYYEEWIWWQKVDFSLEVSDSYTVNVNDVYVDPEVIASTAADLLINKGPTGSYGFGAMAEADSTLNASFSYTVTPNY